VGAARAAAVTPVAAMAPSSPACPPRADEI
jgi:hypothetical protein